MTVTIHFPVLASGHLLYKNGKGGSMRDTPIAPNQQKPVQILFLKGITFINLRILPKD